MITTYLYIPVEKENNVAEVMYVFVLDHWLSYQLCQLYDKIFD